MYLESEFTRPRGDCPHPEHWTAPDGTSTEAEVTELCAAFVRALQPDVVLETGAFRGYTSFALAEALRRNGHGQLIVLEADPGLAATTRIRLDQFRHVQVIDTKSTDWRPTEPIAFAWLDTNFEDREREFRLFHPWLTGVVGFHDTGPHHRVVGETVRQLAAEKLLRPIFLRTPRGVAFCEVLPPREPFADLIEGAETKELGVGIEAARVRKIGDLVYKTFRHDRGDAAHWARVAEESRKHPELNPMLFDAATATIVSKFIDGRRATQEECNALREHFQATGRGHLCDIQPDNVLVEAGTGRPVVIDFGLKRR